MGRESEIVTINRGEIPNVFRSYRLLDEIIERQNKFLDCDDTQHMEYIIEHLTDNKSRAYYLQFMALFLLNEKWVFNRL